MALALSDHYVRTLLAGQRPSSLTASGFIVGGRSATVVGQTPDEVIHGESPVPQDRAATANAE